MNLRNQTIGLLSSILLAAFTVQAASALNFNGRIANKQIKVASDNNNPTGISLSSSSVAENVSANTIVGILNTADSNNGDNFTYNLVAGTGDADNTSFNISGSTLKISSSPDFENKNSYSIRLRTTDGGGLTYEEAFIISVMDINENATSVTLTPSSVVEGVASGTFVGALDSNDPDPGSVFYLLTIEGGDSDDDDNDKFTIVDYSSVDGKFYVSLNGSAADGSHGSTYHIRVYYYDGIGQSFEQALKVTINSVNNDISVNTDPVNGSEDGIK